MTRAELELQGRLSLLFHGEKAIDVVEAALTTGLLRELDAGPVDLRTLAARLGMRPNRLYKLLDCLESLGMVERKQDTDDVLDTRYRSITRLEDIARSVVGPDSIERDRNRQPWRSLHGRLPEVLCGAEGIPEASFAWPPSTPEQVASFERSMAAGIGPIAESVAARLPYILGDHKSTRRVRWLDVGGGDGSLAAHLAETISHLHVDVFNLPSVRQVFAERCSESAASDRLGFVAGDFLEGALPAGYDVISFVRVLHDWPPDVARGLIAKAWSALAPGARIVICEELRTPERLAVQFFWSYFLVGVDSCQSRLREAELYLTWLEAEGGFTSSQVLPGPFDVIVTERV